MKTTTRICAAIAGITAIEYSKRGITVRDLFQFNDVTPTWHFVRLQYN